MIAIEKPEPMAKILMVASEAAPFSKTGGLADVAGALPAALKKRGEETAVVVPLYRGTRARETAKVYEDLRVWLGGRAYSGSIRKAVERDVPFYLVDCPLLYDRDGFYGDSRGDFPDNHIRFAVLSQAALAVVRYLFRPQVIHCHDWQTALVPAYLRTLLAGDPTFMGMKTVFTIHNLGYQGICARECLPETGLDSSVFTPEGLEFYGKVNLLKAGLIYSDALTTVSPKYAKEIQTPEYGFGLDGVLRARAGVLAGILNGADYSEWSPETDRHIPARYSAADLSGKAVCKRELLAEFGFPEEACGRPLIGIVSRFTLQKGFDLIAEIASQLAGEDLSLVALGTGEPRYEKLFADLASAHPGRIAARIAYDDGLAHRIEAGSDIFLMPSRWEPCGLNQIYSLRYGTVPVVRATGGLDDTVDETTGFKFSDYSGAALLGSVRNALAAYRDPGTWREMMLRGMAKDYSWNASAAEYSALYSRLAS